MAQTKIILDTRRKDANGASFLKLRISHGNKTALLTLDIKVCPENWDADKQTVVNHPQKLLINNIIQSKKLEVDTAILRFTSEGRIKTMTANDILKEVSGKAARQREEEEKANLFRNRFVRYMESRTPHTAIVYRTTLHHMERFDTNLASLTFEDVNKDWLTRFDSHMALTAPSINARNIHLRNIRAVFNDAIDDEVTTAYPFRKLKIRPQETAKRALTVEQLRTLFNAEVEPYAEIYLDMFKLIFYLIGINMTDLCNLEEIRDGRVEYHRAKTHKLYTIKVEPEALEIIEKYRGKTRLLNLLDTRKDSDTMLKHMNKALKRIGGMERKGRGGKKHFTPLFPELSTYWARHSWATIAAELEIPQETISHALGHSFGCSTTAIYIDFNTKKVDEANRRVIDYVLYDKR